MLSHGCLGLETATNRLVHRVIWRAIGMFGQDWVGATVAKKRPTLFVEGERHRGEGEPTGKGRG